MAQRNLFFSYSSSFYSINRRLTDYTINRLINTISRRLIAQHHD